MVKNPPANAGDVDLIPGLERCPGVGDGTSLQYSCLGNSMDRRTWWATVHVVTKSQMRLNTFAHIFKTRLGLESSENSVSKIADSHD